MHKRFLAAAALLASSTAYAVPPQIAFAEPGRRGDSIYLVDPDGSRLTKIYEGRSTSRMGAPINRLALRSYNGGGGEVAFVEAPLSLKIQPFADSGQPSGDAYLVTVPAGSCGLGDLDYLSNGSLVVADGCGQVWTVAPGQQTASPLFSAYVASLTALDTSVLYLGSDGWLRSWSSAGTTIIGEFGIDDNFLDATSTTAYLSNQRTFRTVPLESPYSGGPGCTQGGMTEVSPGGSQILYKFRGFLMVHSATCSGSPTRVGRQARSFAWRTY